MQKFAFTLEALTLPVTVTAVLPPKLRKTDPTCFSSWEGVAVAWLALRLAPPFLQGARCRARRHGLAQAGADVTLCRAVRESCEAQCDLTLKRSDVKYLALSNVKYLTQSGVA